MTWTQRMFLSERNYIIFLWIVCIIGAGFLGILGYERVLEADTGIYVHGLFITVTAIVLFLGVIMLARGMAYVRRDSERTVWHTALTAVILSYLNALFSSPLYAKHLFFEVAWAQLFSVAFGFALGVAVVAIMVDTRKKLNE